MDKREEALMRMTRAVANEWIGSLENQMLDSAPGDEEYDRAKEMLERGHEWWVDALVSEVRTNREAQKHLKFAGNKFLQACAEIVLIAMGY